MAFFYISPEWFFGFDIILELLFALITGTVAFFAWKVYKLCGQKECRFLGISFTSIALSYFILAFVNFFAYANDHVEVLSFSRGSTSLAMIAIYSHVILFILGVSALVYLTFKVNNYKLYSLIASLSIIVVIFSSKIAVSFNFVVSVLLFYICLGYGKRYLKYKDKGVLLVFTAFILLLFARLSFVFSSFNPLPYVADHLIEFGAYIMIVISLARTIKRSMNQKTRFSNS